jgi:hypothetical protein
MTMSISPAQLVTALGATDLAAETLQPRGTTAGGAPKTEAPDTEGEHAEPAGPELSTDLRIDDQRRIYYAVINDRTGDVLYEIPPEQIRRLGEGLTESHVTQSAGHKVDVRT